jgi:hypothetical protein
MAGVKILGRRPAGNGEQGKEQRGKGKPVHVLSIGKETRPGEN